MIIFGKNKTYLIFAWSNQRYILHVGDLSQVDFYKSLERLIFSVFFCKISQFILKRIFNFREPSKADESKPLGMLKKNIKTGTGIRLIFFYQDQKTCRYWLAKKKVLKSIFIPKRVFFTVTQYKKAEKGYALNNWVFECLKVWTSKI